MILRGVIFDLGGTLVEYQTPRGWEWPGLVAFRQCLVDFGHQPSPTEVFLAVHECRVADLCQRLEHDPHATQTQDEVLEAMLDEAGIALSPAEWEEARERYYRACQANARLVPGAQETLRAVCARGLRVGSLSNTHWPGARLDQALDALGVAQYLPVRFYSADEGAWKPWPAIFERALRALDLKPEEAAYVGDLPIYDVRGAHGAGMRAVLFSRGGLAPADALTPDATINTLPELLDVLDHWMDAGS
jgi:HAD superfamily hydrolase (TIGR01509 family)